MNKIPNIQAKFASTQIFGREANLQKFTIKFTSIDPLPILNPKVSATQGAFYFRISNTSWIPKLKIFLGLANSILKPC